VTNHFDLGVSLIDGFGGLIDQLQLEGW